MSSVTSCPRCSRQVTIPAGVGTSATVRCPLCHAQYSLADALVNMPPLLELVDDAAAEAIDLAPEPGDGDELQAQAAIAETLEFTPRDDFEDDAPAELDDLAAPAAGSKQHDLGLDDSLDDELHMGEKDTEVEELSFTTSDPAVRAVPDDSEPIDLASDEDSVLEFDSQLPPGVDAGSPRRADADDPAATIDFDDMSGDEIKFDAEGAAPTAAADDEMVFEMADETSGKAAPDEDLELDFQPAGESAAGEEELSLDFGEPIEPEGAPMVPVVAAGDGEEEPAADAKGKKKKKKEKAPAEPGKKRSLSTVLSVVLGAVVAVPVALYVVLWLGPSFDILGIASMLPNSILPSSFNKQYAVRRPVTPPPQLPSEPAADPAAPAEPSTEPPAAEGAAAPAPEATAPTTEEPSGEAPAKTEPPATAPEQPAPAPADAPATEPAPSEPAPAEERPAAPSDDPFAETAKDDAKSKEMPAEPDALPADAPAEPSPAPAAPAPAAEPAADAATKPAPSEELPSPADAAPAPAAEEPVGPIAPLVVGVAELAKALSDATVADQRMVAAIASGNEAEMKKVRSTFYLSLFRLAEVATFAKDDSGSGQLDTLRQSLEQLVRQLAADAKRTDSLKFNAGVWLEYPKRSTHGIILAGKVVSSAPQGRLHEIKLDISLNSHAPVVTVLSEADAGLAVGDQALVVGTIVENPREQIAGYEGAEPAVVWNTMTLKDAAR
jgi:hypothetical protein